MAINIGFEGYLAYKMGGQSGGGAYTEMTNVSDVNFPLEKAVVDVTRRAAGGWRQKRTTLKDGTLSFTMFRDDDDPDFQAMLDGFMDDTVIAFQIRSEAGGQGIQADFQVSKFEDSQPLEEAQTVNVELILAESDTPPSLLT